MRIARAAIVLSIITICAFAGSARAETFEQKISSLFVRHESTFLHARLAENKVCTPAADMQYGRTTEAQRQTCIDDHEEMIDLSRRRFAKEIAWESAVKYNDPHAAQLKRELDELIEHSFAKLDKLERKYSRPRVTTGQLQ